MKGGYKRGVKSPVHFKRPGSGLLKASVYPLFHLLCRFICESNGKNFIGRHSVIDEITHPLGQGLGFTGSRPRKDKKGAIKRFRRLLLSPVEFYHGPILSPLGVFLKNAELEPSFAPCRLHVDAFY